jgi:hypothetical protein
MHLGTEGLEEELTSQVETASQRHGSTIVAFALRR